MTILLIVVRVALAAIFVVAAVGKLRDRAGSTQAMRDFAVPGRFAAPAALLLPVAELVIAAALIPPVTGWYGAIGALGLLGAFSAAIALSIARGREVDCHCFGDLGGGPVGINTLARNAGFGLIGLVVIAAAPDQAGYGWITDLTSGEQIAIGLALAALAVGGVAVLLSFFLVTRILAYRRRIEILERDIPKPGLPVGDPAPDFVLPAVTSLQLGTSEATPVAAAASSNGASENGATAAAGAAQADAGAPSEVAATEGADVAEGTLDALRAVGLPVLLAFTSPTCAPCNAFYPDLAEWQRDHADALTIAVIGAGDADANRDKAAEHALTNVLVQHEGEVAASYLAEGTPVAVLVTPEGKIAAPVARGAAEIHDLTAALRAVSAMRN